MSLLIYGRAEPKSVREDGRVNPEGVIMEMTFDSRLIDAYNFEGWKVSEIHDVLSILCSSNEYEELLEHAVRSINDDLIFYYPEKNILDYVNLVSFRRGILIVNLHGCYYSSVLTTVSLQYDTVVGDVTPISSSGDLLF